jgi:hypothetical protein
VSSPRWPGYLDAFHIQHPGITEHVLCHARAADGDAYDFLAAAVPADATVRDLGCGTLRCGRGCPEVTTWVWTPMRPDSPPPAVVAHSV